MNRIVLAAVLCLLASCAHVPSERERESSRIHYELAVERQHAGSVQEAYQELQKALALDPQNAGALNMMGVLLHLSFQRPEEAVRHYQKALALPPALLEAEPRASEVRTNLGNAYLDLERYDEAIAQYEQALNDMLYATPYFAMNNMGWALYKKGQVDRGLEAIRSAVTTNPGFCLGFRNLGLIYEQTGQGEEALRAYGRYREACPEAADAYRREGVVQAALGRVDAARDSFALCEAKASQADLKAECRMLAEKLP